MPSGLNRKILPRGLVRSCEGVPWKCVAGGEVDLAVVAEIDCAAVVFGVGVLGILVEDEFAARYGAGQCGIGREAREAIAVGCARGVGDVIEVVGGEVRIQG